MKERKRDKMVNERRKIKGKRKDKGKGKRLKSKGKGGRKFVKKNQN